MKPLVSSVRVTREGVEDHVVVAVRGKKEAGLVLCPPGDGNAIAERIAGRRRFKLLSPESDIPCDHESAADVVARELGNVREAVGALAKQAHADARTLDRLLRAKELADPGDHVDHNDLEIGRVESLAMQALGRLVAAVEALPR